MKAASLGEAVEVGEAAAEDDGGSLHRLAAAYNVRSEYVLLAVAGYYPLTSVMASGRIEMVDWRSDVAW